MEQVVSFLFNHRQALFSKSQFSFGARPSMLLLVALIAGLALLAYFLYAVPAVTGSRLIEAVHKSTA